MEEHNLNVEIPGEVLDNLLYYTAVTMSKGGRHCSHDCITMYYMKTTKRKKSCLTFFTVEYQKLGSNMVEVGEVSPKSEHLIKLLDNKLLSKKKTSKVEDLKKEFLRSSESADEFAMGVIFALEEIGKVSIDEAF